VSKSTQLRAASVECNFALPEFIRLSEVYPGWIKFGIGGADKNIRREKLPDLRRERISTRVFEAHPIWWNNTYALPDSEKALLHVATLLSLRLWLWLWLWLPRE